MTDLCNVCRNAMTRFAGPGAAGDARRSHLGQSVAQYFPNLPPQQDLCLPRAKMLSIIK
jgi:hypothetical protein